MNVPRILLSMLLAALLVLTGCATQKVPVLVGTTQVILMSRCPPNLTAHDGGMDGESLLKTMLKWTDEYNVCAARQNAAVDAQQSLADPAANPENRR